MTRVLALSSVLVAGCPYHHVDLRPPAPELSGEQRVAAFMELKPVDQAFLRVSGDGGETWELSSTSLLLANHAEVVAPEDLIPVVDPSSETARAASASVAARRKSQIAWYAGVASLVGGYIMIGGFGFNGTPFGVTPWVGGSMIAAGLISAVFVSRHYGHVELNERRFAFAHYTRDLGDHLNVCASGLQVVPCEESPVTKPPPPTTTQPATTAQLLR